MATLQEMLDEQARIKGELQRMEADDEVTEEKDGDYRDTLVQRWEELDAATKPLITRMERIRGITHAAEEPANREPGADGVTRWAGRGPEVMRHLDPFEDLGKIRQGLVAGNDMIARSMTVVERHNKRGILADDRAQEATRKAQMDHRIARHMLLHGTDEYWDAFRHYLTDPTGEGLQRAAGALSLAVAQGGYLLPYQLDPTIVLTSDGSANPYRRLARVETTTTNNWHGVNSAGVQAAYLDEATAAGTAAYQGVGQFNIFPKKAAAWVYGSFEAAQDTNFSDQLPRLLQDGKDILEESKFAAGVGTNTDNTGTPRGIANALTVSQRAAAIGTAADSIYSLEAALGARFRSSPRCAFVANLSTINKVRNFSPSGAGSAFWATLGDGTPSRLLNRPIYESTSITASTATAGSGTGNISVVLGDWNQFVIVDRVGTSMLFEPLIKDTSTGAPSGQQGWFYWWRSGSDVATANGFRYLTVT